LNGRSLPTGRPFQAELSPADRNHSINKEASSTCVFGSKGGASPKATAHSPPLGGAPLNGKECVDDSQKRVVPLFKIPFVKSLICVLLSPSSVATDRLPFPNQLRQKHLVSGIADGPLSAPTWSSKVSINHNKL
jgi:hypothetical protein